MSDTDYPWRDEKTLREMYVDKRMTPKMIGDELGCHSRTVNDWLDRHGIDRRDPIENAKIAWAHRPAHYRTGTHGYERWEVRQDYEKYYCFVHRLIAVAEWGFDAVCDRVVHHKNGHRWDNRVENLEILSTEEHSRIHYHDRDDISNEIGLAAQWGEDAVEEVESE